MSQKHSHSKKSEVTNFTLDYSDEATYAEIISLREQIDSIEAAIDQFKAESIKKTGEFEAEITQLKSQIKIAEENQENLLAKVKEENASELRKLEEKHEEEIENLKRENMKATSMSNQIFSHRKNLTLARKEAELVNLQRQLQQIQIKNERSLDNSSVKSRFTSNMEKQKRYNDLKIKIQSLQEDISDIRTSTQQNLLDAKLKLKETEYAYQERSKKSLENIAKTRQRLLQVKDESAVFLNNEKRKQYMMIRKYTDELNEAEEKLRLMTTMFYKLKEKFHTQTVEMNQEINMTKTAIEQGRERLNQLNTDLVGNEQKLFHAQKQAIVIQSEINVVSAELEETRKGNITLKREKRRMETKLFNDQLNRLTASNPIQHFKL